MSDEMVLLEPMDIAFVTRKVQEGWEYSPRRFAWIAAAAWWLLNKVGAVSPYFGTVKVYRFRAPKKSDAINEAVFNIIKDRSRGASSLKDYAVVMGFETFRDLMHDAQELRPMASQVFQFTAGPFGYRGEMFGVPVHVVDTIKGVALIPKLVIERRP